jgi:hypothetical protein
LGEYASAMVVFRKIPLLIVSFFLLAAYPVAGFSQSLTLLVRIPLKRPTAVSADRYDNIYVGDHRGNILKFDPEGTLLQEFSPPQPGVINAIEAWSGMSIFSFSESLQAFTLLNRFLTPAPGAPFRVTPEVSSFARTATLATDGQVWIFSDSDFELLKYDYLRQAVTLRIPLALTLQPQKHQIVYMREYQNMLFLVDRQSGVFVFDNLGNYKKKLPLKGLDFLGFQKDEMCALVENKLYFYHLYTSAEQFIELPAGTRFQFALPLSNKVALFSPEALYLYHLEK